MPSVTTPEGVASALYRCELHGKGCSGICNKCVRCVMVNDFREPLTKLDKESAGRVGTTLSDASA